MFDVKKPFFLQVLFKSFFLIGIILFFPNSTVYAQGPKKIKTIIIDAGHGGADPGAYAEYEGNLGSIEKNITLAITLKLVKILKEKMPDVNILPTRTTDITQSVKEKAQFANENNGDLFVCIHADAVTLKTGSRIIGYKTENYTTTKHVGKGKKRKKVVTKHTREVPIKQYYKIPTTRKGTSTLLLVARQTQDKIKALENADTQFITDTDSSLNIDHNSPEWKAIALLYSQLYFKKSYWLANAVQEEVEKTGRINIGVWQRDKGLWVLHATQMPAILIETGFLANGEDERYLASEEGQQELAEAIAKAIIRYRDMVDNPGGHNSTTTKP